MAHEYITRRRVAWVDTDAARIVHFSNFFRYMEQAEHAFFNSLGISIHMDVGGRMYTFPRVHASGEFFSPLRFEDEVEVRVMVRRVRTRSIVFDFFISRLDADGPAPSARGTITTVCITRDAEGRMRAAEIPAPVRDKITASPPDELAKWDTLFPSKGDTPHA